MAKNVIVTGASRGIGFKLVQQYAEAGHEVIAISRNSDRLEELKEACLQLNPQAQVHILSFDLAKGDIAAQLMPFIESCFQHVDILINNAGITGPTAELWNYSVDDWNKVINVNLNGTYICCKLIVPLMIKNNYGRIVNIASVSGKDGNANASAYSSAKAGVLGLTKSLGKELAQYNIAVNAVTPAGAKTRILNQMTKEHVQRMLSKVPRGRFLELDELSSLVCWLSSEDNSFSTAAVFDISGGRSTY